jgi:hypothetical protein
VSGCEHRSQIFVPHEDDPDVLVQMCLNCGSALGVTHPDDPELEDIGHSLGDPDEEDY